MVALKSQGDVKLYVDLCVNVLRDSRSFYPSDGCLQRDIDTVVSRVNREGIPFLTVTLPKLGKAVDESLETGWFNRPKEFKAHGRGSEVPAFMHGLLHPCYSDEGHLVGMQADRLKAIRQVCYLCYKLELPYSQEQEASVIDSFLATEEELKRFQMPLDDWYVARAADIVEELLRGFNPKEIVPRHGPGAVATGEKLDAKWRFSRLYASIHNQFPYYEYFVVGSRNLLDEVRWYRGLERRETPIAKVVLVPKDSRGPRLISCESLETQWIQQGLGRKFVEVLEKHPLSKGRINFTDQEINRKLALQGSSSGEWATLDLKDASDRVSLQLVKRLFPERVYLALLAARSTATNLPDGRIVPMLKHAPMGSALCFPVMALCVWALSVAAIAQSARKSTQEVAPSVFVYGDDLIVASDHFNTVVEALEYCGLRVNTSKCFRRSGPSFRESCGMDAYCGHEVTPVKVRKPWTGKPGDGCTYASWVAYANELAAHGFPNASERAWKQLESTFGRIPHGVETSAFPCRIGPSWLKSLLLNLELGFPVRESPDRGEGDVNYMRVEIKVRFLKSDTQPTILDGWSRLLRDLTAGHGEDPSLVTLPQSVQLRTGWRSM